ncbi:hypothetical protein PEBR_27691 [Penicillium brasilianum]|uniref:Uncharacterized protein n=1 Tax=Penicillium brasilianum TaxID=104259 RepID=A0A1S9RVR6_PENBI|nr:hypothetical protein PEBR_27691 [Penicillium brasilianum]
MLYLVHYHDVSFLDDDSAVLTIFDPEIRDLTPYGATSDDQQWILNNKIQRVDTDSNRVLWKGSSLDHVDPAYTNFTLQSGNAGLGTDSSQVWQYFYMNAFDVNPETLTYLISASKHVHSNFSVSKGVNFCCQHETRMHTKYLHHETKGSKEIFLRQLCS